MDPKKDLKKDTQKELDIALGELEERVDRLRSLYEQYFMGYEKIEPGVQRKDVERRFTVLRKAQIRNTAQRFRFNVITQKYNTYVMYWTRVCRQIEEGTYKRHVAKAARRFGPDADAPSKKRDAEYSIEVDLGDFDDVDEGALTAVLAEADAAADAYARESSDTLPPGERSAPPVAAKGATAAIPIQRLTPAGSFRTPGRPAAVPAMGEPDLAWLDSLDPPDVEPGPARHGGPPPAAKPRVVLRRRDPAPPPAQAAASTASVAANPRPALAPQAAAPGAPSRSAENAAPMGRPSPQAGGPAPARSVEAGRSPQNVVRSGDAPPPARPAPAPVARDASAPQGVRPGPAPLGATGGAAVRPPMRSAPGYPTAGPAIRPVAKSPQNTVGPKPLGAPPSDPGRPIPAPTGAASPRGPSPGPGVARGAEGGRDPGADPRRPAPPKKP